VFKDAAEIQVDLTFTTPGRHRHTCRYPNPLSRHASFYQIWYLRSHLTIYTVESFETTFDYFSSSSGKETSINLSIDSNKTLRDLLLLAEGRNDYTTPSHWWAKNFLNPQMFAGTQEGLFFLPLNCLSFFDLRILINPLVSSSLFCTWRLYVVFVSIGYMVLDNTREIW
jgi:hypothetical protein